MGGVAAVASLAASAFGIYKTATAKAPETPAAPVLPPAPTVDPAADDAKARAAGVLARRRAAATPGLGSTMLTGPSGVTTPAPVAYKTLLGA